MRPSLNLAGWQLNPGTCRLNLAAAGLCYQSGALRISVFFLLVVGYYSSNFTLQNHKRTQELHVYSGELAGTALPQVAECAGWMRLNPADRMPLSNEPKDAEAAPQSPHACNNGAACVAGGC